MSIDYEYEEQSFYEEQAGIEYDEQQNYQNQKYDEQNAANNSCLICGKVLQGKDVSDMERVGVPPLCSQYCFEVYNGTPMPSDQGGFIFGEIFNK